MLVPHIGIYYSIVENEIVRKAMANIAEIPISKYLQNHFQSIKACQIILNFIKFIYCISYRYFYCFKFYLKIKTNFLLNRIKRLASITLFSYDEDTNILYLIDFVDSNTFLKDHIYIISK